MARFVLTCKILHNVKGRGESGFCLRQLAPFVFIRFLFAKLGA
jgi:hypothetical protein